jgi:large subunit ribosomal protein L30
MNASEQKIKVTLTRSIHGQLERIAASVRGLGLRRMHQSALVQDTPQNRGMIERAKHMLKIENVK